ncbi:sulfurtransferase complex subunit TusB [Thioflexithrix psekupsensis]|uniref:Sulfurtransferase TusB n=1 Tax=Thioflexithrix psekupsensis TaxID=1570016 RepID=A0A251X7Z2_9GAMM|nr:sulfurtransferase complex subunit TusB [Thioflexithrix psekupsensis]OUD14091.1 sulfurtransferase TusB [Thioflexithrix psekupsensis]
MLLHTVNKSPFERVALQTCLRLSQAGCGILLLEDGVYAALQGTQTEAQIKDALNDKKVYALLPDLQARGFTADKVIAGVQLIDYNGFVDLVIEYQATQAWL